MLHQFKCGITTVTFFYLKHTLQAVKVDLQAGRKLAMEIKNLVEGSSFGGEKEDQQPDSHMKIKINIKFSLESRALLVYV